MSATPEASLAADAINRASLVAGNLVYDYAAKFEHREDYTPLHDLANAIQRAIVEEGVRAVKQAGAPVVPQTIEPGHVVALVLLRPVAGLSCYVGEVQTVDAHGVRVTLVDWLTGLFTGMDFYVPWPNIDAAQVATDEHTLAGDEFQRFQAQVEQHREPSPADLAA